MHCPNCGKPATADQQFCRNCGMGLDSVVKLVAEHSATIAPSQTKIDKARLEQEMVRHMFKWLTIGMIILGIGVLMLVVNKNFDLGKWFGLASSCLLLGGTGLASFGVLNAIRKGASLPFGASLKELPESRNKSLPTNPFPEALPSVTERTTQLILTQDDNENGLTKVRRTRDAANDTSRVLE